MAVALLPSSYLTIIIEESDSHPVIQANVGNATKFSSTTSKMVDVATVSILACFGIILDLVC